MTTYPKSPATSNKMGACVFCVKFRNGNNQNIEEINVALREPEVNEVVRTGLRPEDLLSILFCTLGCNFLEICSFQKATIDLNVSKHNQTSPHRDIRCPLELALSGIVPLLCLMDCDACGGPCNTIRDYR